MARRATRFLIGLVLWLLILLALAAAIVPRFLDRRYHDGARSGHFDGARFFNSDGEDTLRPPGGGSRAGFFWRYLTDNDDRPRWPASVHVAQAKPAARVAGEAMVATWVGHATVLVQTQGLNILTDPVWSDTAGPFGFGPRRVTRPGIAFDDLPKIDVIVVSHNHYDHMDLATLKRLWARDRPLIVTSLGNDAILRGAGVDAKALDWGDRLKVQSACAASGGCPTIDVAVTRNHHWGSRWFTDRNRALWSSFVVTLPGGNLFFAGDTGLGDGRWPAEARALGPVRLAIIPIGAFRFSPGEMGTGSHIGPVDAVRVYEGLGATTALPIHWGTFRLSYEAFDTPPRMLDALMRCSGHDAARFRGHAIGRAFAVPPLSTPPPARAAALDACARRPAVTALQ